MKWRWGMIRWRMKWWIHEMGWWWWNMMLWYDGAGCAHEPPPKATHYCFTWDYINSYLLDSSEQCPVSCLFVYNQGSWNTIRSLLSTQPDQVFDIIIMILFSTQKGQHYYKMTAHNLILAFKISRKTVFFRAFLTFIIHCYSIQHTYSWSVS